MCNLSSKFSCADFTFPLLPHYKVLQLIKLIGIDAVDIGLFEGRSHHFPSDISKNPTKEGIRLVKDLKEIGLEPADVFLQTGEEPNIAATNSPDKNTRKNNRNTFLKTLEFTKTLGCKHITGLPGVFHEKQTTQDDWKIACEENHWRVEKAKEFNITYAIEAHVGSILPDAISTLKFIKECPEITLTLDYGHFIYQGQTNKSVHPLIKHTSHFHARGGAKGKLQTSVKDNKIDFKAIALHLKQNKYSGFTCMEYVHVDWEGCNKTDNISETIRLHNLLKQLVYSE